MTFCPSDLHGGAENLGLLFASAPFTAGELHAMVLDGVLRHVVGLAFAPRGLPDSRLLRAEALAHHIPAALSRSVALGGLSAAWVYGCAPPPHRIELVQDISRRGSQLPPFSGCSLRQLQLGKYDVEWLGRRRITSVLRTATDVARGPGGRLASDAVKALSALPGCSVEEMMQAVAAAGHVPGKLRAMALLRELSCKER